MSKIFFKLNKEGVRELLQGEEMQGIIASYGSNVVNNAGVGYGKDVKVGKKRCYCNISAKTPRAYFSNLKHNTLIKALR